jgi:hypothetical protein
VNQREDTVEPAVVIILVAIGLLYGIWRSIGGNSEQKMTPAGNVQNRAPAPSMQNRIPARNVRNKRPTATVEPDYYAKIKNLESRWRTIKAFSADHGETELREAISRFYGDRAKALEYIIERWELENRSWR